MLPAQGQPAPTVLVFDVNETLIDIESMAPLFGELFGDRRVLREWFGQLVMYSMTITLAECYVDFFALGQGVLRMLADIHRVNITDDDVLRLRTGMLTMPAHPDAADGLARSDAPGELQGFQAEAAADVEHVHPRPHPRPRDLLQLLQLLDAVEGLQRVDIGREPLDMVDVREGVERQVFAHRRVDSVYYYSY